MTFRIFDKNYELLKNTAKVYCFLTKWFKWEFECAWSYLARAMTMEIRILKPINLFVDTIAVERMNWSLANFAYLCL